MPETIAPAPTFYVDSGGSLVPLPPEQIADAEALGWTPATPEMLAAHARSQKYGSLPQQIATGVESAGSALTFGASTALERALGVPAEDIAGREEENPVASGIGTGLGIAVPLVATFGADAPVAGAQAATAGARGAASAAAKATAPALISRAGQAVTRGVEAALPEATTVAGKIAARAASMGAGSAVEGAAYGLGQVVHEAALGDPNLTAQSALAEIGLSAALGGAFGGALGGVTEAVPGLLTKARDALGSAVAKAKDAYPELAERLTGGAVSADMVREAQAKYGAAFKDPREVARLQKDLGGSLEDVANQVERTKRTMYGEARPLETEHLLAGQDPATLAVNAMAKREGIAGALTAAAEEARLDPDLVSGRVVGEIEKIRDGFLRRTAAGGSAAPEAAIPSWGEFTKERMGDYMKRLGGHGPAMEALSADFKALKEEAAAAARNTAPADARTIFEELRTTRRQLDDLSEWSKVNRDLPPIAQGNAVKMARSLRGAVKEAITDEAAWGPAAARHAVLDELNTQYQRAFKSLTSGKLGPLNSNILPKVARDGQEAFQLNPRALKTALNQMGDPRGERVAEAIFSYLDAAGRYVNGMEETYSHLPTSAFDREALTNLVGKARSLSEQAHTQAEATRFLNELNPDAVLGSGGAKALLPQGTNAGALGGLGTVALAPVVGHMIPGAGPVLAAYGAVKAGYHVLEGMKNIPQTVATLARLERITQRVTRAIDVGTSTLVRGSVKASYVGRGEAMAGIARVFSQEADSASASFHRRASEIQRLAQDPEQMHRALLTQNGTLDDHAPQTAQALSIASSRAVAFLASKLPRMEPRGPLAPAPEQSPAEIAKWNRYYEAVQSPASILKQAAAGTLTREAVEAVATVYPDLYAKMQGALAEKIAAHGNKVPYQARLMAGMILGQDLDGSVGLIVKHQGSYAAPQGKPSSGPAPHTSKSIGRITLADRTLTPAQRSAQR